jgi:hypothetical protein
MPFRSMVAVLALAGLVGCASVQPVLVPSAAADPGAGYVAGLFTRMKARGYAFVVRATEGGAEYVMPLGEDSRLPTQVTDQTVAIKLPPGTYTVSQWITYATLTREIMSRKAITGSVLSQPFTVKAGTVVHLGSFDVSEYTSGYPATTYMRIQPRRFSEAEVRQAFAATYPNLTSQAFRCILCTDTVGAVQTKQ